MSTEQRDLFQSRNSFAQTRRGLDSPHDRDRVQAALDSAASSPGTSSAGSSAPEPGSQQPAGRTRTSSVRTITWGTALKVSFAIYWAVLGVLATLVVVVLLLARFAPDQIDEFRDDWRGSAPSAQTGTSQ